MNKDRTTIKLIASVLLAISTVVLFMFVFKIIENKNKHTNATISALELKMIEKENLDLMADKISEYEETQSLIDGYFLEKQKADLFVEFLENLGKENNTELTVKSIEIDNKKDGLISLKIFIYGDFNSVVKTISLLENSNYSISINNLYLNKELSSGEASQLDNGVFWGADISFDVLSF